MHPSPKPGIQCHLPSSPPILPISAIIPVAGRPQLLREAIVSIASGSALPREILVVLSPLQTKKGNRYLDKTVDPAVLQQDLPRLLSPIQDAKTSVRILTCPRPYAAAARNQGAALAQNAWLAFLDSDDIWHRDKLIKQWNYLRQRPQLRACHSAEEWLRSSRRIRQPVHLRPHRGRFIRAAFGHCLISCSALLIRKDTFQECGGFDESFEVCEDFAFFLRYLKDHPIGVLNERLTIKRSGDWPQLSAKYHSLDALRIQGILKFLKAFGSELKPEEQEAACQSLWAKLAILTSGASRRGHENRFRELQKEIAMICKEN